MALAMHQLKKILLPDATPKVRDWNKDFGQNVIRSQKIAHAS